MRHRYTFRAVDAGDGSDGRWAQAALAVWDKTMSWFGGERSPEEAAHARQLFDSHLPELVPVRDQLAARLAGAGAPVAEVGAAMTQTVFRPLFSGCTQSATGGALVRNYDFHPDVCEGTVVRSHFLRPVLGTQDSGWGLLDGVNDAGLAVSLTFGGRPAFRPGLSIVIIVRYLLETCDTVGQALGTLGSLPFATAHNLTLVDRTGAAATVHTGPDIGVVRTSDGCAANHQHTPVPAEQERVTRTGERLAAIRAAAEAGAPDAVVAALLRPPLYSTAYEDHLGTLYTADYRPAEGSVTYHWPGESAWRQSLDSFRPGERTVTLGG
ncbi:C45 family peptidase [Streptomyces sp. RFCAC02]|uniref:C45 family autoproteolytic acyltransferase/hydolase n=1 Tax=Streptomyces sp. RFCAC02 TaxID=2499143 RepID=UPI0010207160|nr:C45 family peptidase [Streptomyces sp. RFCAC02]